MVDKKEVIFREATDNDISFVFNLRNNPLVWKGLYTQSRENRPLQWDEHLNWWKSRHNWKMFVIQADGKDVGVLNFGQLDCWIPQVGLYLHPDEWNKGIGRQALKLGLDWLKLKKYSACHTTILKDNIRSIKLFKGLGFRRIGEARKGESWWQTRL